MQAASLPAAPSAKALAFLRIATGVLFLIFAQYKLTGPKFIWGGGMAFWIHRFLEGGAYPFMRGFLERIVLPHAVAFALCVGIGELLIGLSLVLGVLVRSASAGGLIMMLVLLFASNYPGPDAPFWQFFGASLDHSVLALIFVALILAGRDVTWSIVSRRPIDRTK